MKKSLKYLISSIITFIILGIVYYFNNLYPFGNMPLVQVDADFIYIPILYKRWDILHEGGNLFYTNLGLGNSLYGSLIIQGSLYSPLNLLLYLVDRNNLVNFFGLFIIIKLCLVSLTSYIYIEKTYKINYFYKVLFSILYTFNGFMILNYFNEIWLDIVILFPLLILYLNKLLKNGNQLGYIIILSICFIITFYYSYFMVVFILLYSFIYLNLYNKGKIKDVIFKLGISTLMAFLISSFSSLPLIYQIFNSLRFNSAVYTNMFSNIEMKSLYLLFSPLFIIIFIRLLTRFKGDKVNVYCYFILILLYIIPVIIDPINALMHGGNYWSFPYRYGYITSFILMDCCLYYISKYEKKSDFTVYKKDIIFTAIIIIFGIIGYRLNQLYRNNIISNGIFLEIKNNNYQYIIYMILVVFLMYIVMLFIKNKWFKYILIGGISLYGILLFTSWTIYYNSGYFLCTNAKKVHDNIKIKNDGRYKVEYDNYTPGYGFIFNVNTLDNWLHIIPSNEINIYRKLGYYVTDTRIYSYGGTIFTDYLLNFKYIFSKDDKIKDDMYDLIDSYNDKYLYKYNYDNSYGVIIDEIEEIGEYNKFDYQNKIYKNLYNRDTNIINYNKYENNESDKIDINYKIYNNGYLYFYTDYYDNIDHVCINSNCIYGVNNYIKYLGYYNEDVDIIIYLKEKNYIDYYVGFIEKKDILNLSNNIEYKNNKYYVNVDNDKYLFLPINNINGLQVFNNNKEEKIYSCLDNFVCIKLNKGNNVIEIKYKQPLFNIGIIFSLIGVILLLLYKRILPNKIILNISYWLYNMIVIGMFLYYYLYSLFKYIV